MIITTNYSIKAVSLYCATLILELYYHNANLINLVKLINSGVAKPGPTWTLAQASPHWALASKIIKACDQTVPLQTDCIFNESLYRYVDDNDV